MTELLSLVPKTAIDWQKIENSFLAGCLLPLAQVQQNPRWHGEGDVLTHTKMVCESLCAMASYRALPEEERAAVFLAALLHDIGKATRTRLEDGVPVSPGHGSAGAFMARELLWERLSGTPEKQNLRETVCALIAFHSMPSHAILRDDGAKGLRKAASVGLNAPGFTVEKLCILAEADARGRICSDLPEILERIDLCRQMAVEEGCFRSAYRFPSAHTGYRYFTSENIPAHVPLYNDTWGQVVLLSGLPGTGKDTFIATHCPGAQVVSLDEIRKELGIRPTEGQGPVIEKATERAKALLRSREGFIWNATNLTEDTRRRLVQLFTGYGAAVQIVYLETDWQENLRRNESRQLCVPRSQIAAMLRKLSPPMSWEAHDVKWYCV